MLVPDVIARDHRNVQQLFFALEEALPQAHEELEALIEELDVHAHAEEAVFYPAVREVSRRIDDAEHAHEHMRVMIDAGGAEPRDGGGGRRLRGRAAPRPREAGGAGRRDGGAEADRARGTAASRPARGVTATLSGRA